MVYFGNYSFIIDTISENEKEINVDENDENKENSYFREEPTRGEEEDVPYNENTRTQKNKKTNTKKFK